MNTRFTLILLFLSCFFMGCPDDDMELKKFIKQYHFIPFNYANASYEPLTIMKFSRRSDNEIVADPEDCVEAESSSYLSDDETIKLLKKSYTVERAIDGSLVIPKELLTKAQLEAGFSDSLFKQIEIEFIDPFISYVSTIKAQRLFTDAASDCKEAVTAPDNIIINKVLGAEGLIYRFIGYNNKIINFDAEVFDSITADAEYRRQLNTNGSLLVNQRMFFGYTAFKGGLQPGIIEIENAEIDLIEITEEEFTLIRDNASKPRS